MADSANNQNSKKNRKRNDIYQSSCIQCTNLVFKLDILTFVETLKMPSYKLTYFNARARAELARIIFTVAGVEFEDERIEMEDWPARKACE